MISRLMCSIFFSLLAFSVTAEGEKKTVESVVDVSIIGSSELPSVSFNLPWRLPSVEKREEQSPSVDIPNLLDPIEPEKHKQLVHFSKYLEMDLPAFKAR